MQPQWPDRNQHRWRYKSTCATCDEVRAESQGYLSAHRDFDSYKRGYLDNIERDLESWRGSMA